MFNILFADDSKLAQIYKINYERNISQAGLNNLYEYVSYRNLEFGNNLYEYVSYRNLEFGNIKNKYNHGYSINRISLINDISYIDLGIIITNNLVFSMHKQFM